MGKAGAIQSSARFVAEPFDKLRACEKIDVWLECNRASFETPAKAGSSG